MLETGHPRGTPGVLGENPPRPPAFSRGPTSLTAGGTGPDTCRLLQERAQLDCQLCDTSVIVQMDNSRDLDMEGIIKSVECCYEEIAQKSKAEVEAFYQTRVSTGSARTGTNETSWPTEPQGPFLSSVMQLTTHAAVRRRCRLLEKVMPKSPNNPKNTSNCV